MTRCRGRWPGGTHSADASAHAPGGTHGADAAANSARGVRAAVPRLTWTIGRLRTAKVLALLVLVAASRSWASGPEFDFHAPPTVSDATTPAVMRDLAERLIPVYQESDPERYLANLSALQMAAGDYAAADVSRQSLRDRRRKVDLGRPVGRGVVYDMYARAKVIEAENRATFSDSFMKSFREVVPRLSDQDAFAVIAWLATPPAMFREALQKAFDQQRSKDGIGQSEAVELLRSYLAFDAYRSIGPLVDSLDAEEDRRRYTSENDVLIKTADGASIAVAIVRPADAAKPLPALLEFTVDDMPTYSKESAAHGYVGVVAYTRGMHNGSRRVVPYQHDGEDARAVVNWIARQPWSDGSVGMYGDGYSGFAAWAAAKRPIPALKAIATSASAAPGISAQMDGNIFQNSAYRWSLRVTHTGGADQSSYGDDALWRSLDQKWYESGRRYRDMGRLFGKPNPIFIRWLNHPSYDRFWQKMSPYRDEFAHINIPVLTMTGYYAANAASDLYYFTEHYRYNPRADHTLAVGPYDDSAMRRGPLTALQGYQVDSAALIDFHELRYQWFDHVLKGGSKPPLLKDRINYEVMGANEWRHVASLADMATGSLRFYLTAATSTAAPGASHRLTQNKPLRPAFTRQTVSFTDRSDSEWTTPSDLVGKTPAIRYGTMFLSDPLTKSSELGGLFSGRLDFTVNKMDMDLSIVLYELRTDGEYVRLFSPAYEFRASYAKDRVHRRLLKAGERQALSFKIERITSRRLPAGSRLAMVLSINKRPDREINYGMGNDVSEESIEDGKIPLKVRWYSDSYIEVPVRR